MPRLRPEPGQATRERVDALLCCQHLLDPGSVEEEATQFECRGAIYEPEGQGTQRTDGEKELGGFKADVE